MSSKENVERAMFMQGRNIALEIQAKSKDMDGTEINSEKDFIPKFTEAVKTMNMLERSAGFVCKSSEGRIVKLIQPYDSTIFTDEPEKLPAQWGFVWSDNPEHALPFIALSTSPYMTGNVCTDEGNVWKSKIDNNVFRPTEYPQGWEQI